jgi:hypothetical protein
MMACVWFAAVILRKHANFNVATRSINRPNS